MGYILIYQLDIIFDDILLHEPEFILKKRLNKYLFKLWCLSLLIYPEKFYENILYMYIEKGAHVNPDVKKETSRIAFKWST